MIEAAKLEADIYPAGPRGLSAYEIYKKEGGQLSEEEWLKSLNGLTPTIGENGNWFLGTVDTGLPSRGPKGDTGSIKFIVVTELPTENIDETAIYLKPVESPTGENKFEELIYVNGKWEDLGTPNVAVDLSNYYTKTEVKQITGELTDLSTKDKSNLVNAINEVMESGGDLGIEIVDFGTFASLNDNTAYTKHGEELGKAIIRVTENGSKYGTLIIYGGKDWAIFRVNKSGTSGSYIKYVLSGIRCYFQTSLQYSSFAFINFEVTIDPDTNIVNNTTRTGYYSYHPDKLLTTDNTTSYTPTADYHPATKKYVDDTISAKGGDKLHDYNIYTITLDDYNLKGTFPTITDTTTLAKFDEILTDIYKKRISANATHDNAFLIVYSKADTFIFRTNTIQASYCYLYGTYIEEPIDTNGHTRSYQFYITGTLDTTAQTFKTTKVKFDRNSKRVLLTNNTLSYTPTGDYNPSTKLYTDKTHYEKMTGYDATKTQVLKNINGTLTWVDEV